MFNILQWFGTVVVDCRAHAPLRLRESVVGADAASAAALPLKDDAMCIAAPDEVLGALGGRVRGGLYALSADYLQFYLKAPVMKTTSPPAAQLIAGYPMVFIGDENGTVWAFTLN